MLAADPGPGYTMERFPDNGSSECFRRAILACIIIFDVGALPIENSISRKAHA